MNPKTLSKDKSKPDFYIKNNTLYLSGMLLKHNVPLIYNSLFSRNNLKELKELKFVDGKEILDIDSAGVALIDEISEKIVKSPNEKELYIGFTESVKEKIEIFSVKNLENEIPVTKISLLENLGASAFSYLEKLLDMLVLTSDIVYWSIVALWNKKGQRRGSLTQQSLLIGADALPIVCLLSFIIGLIISLQSAVQLKQFGADQFLANLLAFTLVRELSPLITAIILAGRSGSAIASEIATMKVTEEIDALKMMALNPIRYVVVPKFLAITICMPLLVMISIILGILGGFIIGLTYLDLTFVSYFNQTLSILEVKDLLIGLSKSVFFAWVIVIISSFFGFKAEGGAEGVGIVTTSSVVASIFAVIVLNALFSLIYM